MQVSNADFQSFNLQTNAASDAIRENPQGRRALNAEEEAKVEELKSQEAIANNEEKVEIKQIEEQQKGTEAGHEKNDGHNHTGQTQDVKEQTMLSANDIQKRIDEELVKQKAKKAQLFNSSGQTSKPKPESSVVDVFG